MAVIGSGYYRSRWETLRGRQDFTDNPLRAIWRRLYWRFRWFSSKSPWQLRLADNALVLAPRTGTAALIFYQGFSEPETAHFIKRILKPGMTFFDLGAHVGEYTVIGARCVGESGCVHAFEPEPSLAVLLEETLSRNKICNSVICCCAVSDTEGMTEFAVGRELADSSIRTEATAPDRDIAATIAVPSTTLDKYCSVHGLLPHVIKVDVEGAELLVLKGAKELLNLSASVAPIWILEVSIATYSRFGNQPLDLCTQFYGAGYKLFELTDNSELRPFTDLSNMRTRNLVATKRPLF